MKKFFINFYIFLRKKNEYESNLEKNLELPSV